MQVFLFNEQCQNSELACLLYAVDLQKLEHQQKQRSACIVVIVCVCRLVVSSREVDFGRANDCRTQKLPLHDRISLAFYSVSSRFVETNGRANQTSPMLLSRRAHQTTIVPRATIVLTTRSVVLVADQEGSVLLISLLRLYLHFSYIHSAFHD